MVSEEPDKTASAAPDKRGGNVPLAMAATALALRLPRPGGAGRVDLPGAALIAGAVVSLLLVAERGGRTHGWTSGTILALIGAVAALAALFAWWEGRASNPLLPLRLFADPVLRVVLPATALLGGSIVYLPTYLQAAYGMGATEAGLALNPYVLTFMAVSSLAGARIGASGRYKPYLLTGSAIAVLAFVLLSRLTPGTPYAVLAVEIAVLGFGFGLLMQNLVVVAQNAVSAADLAATTSAAVSVRGLGLSLGVSVFGTLLARETQGRAPGPEATTAAIPDALFWGAPAAAVLLALMALLPRGPEQPTAAQQAARTPADAAP